MAWVSARTMPRMLAWQMARTMAATLEPTTGRTRRRRGRRRWLGLGRRVTLDVVEGRLCLVVWIYLFNLKASPKKPEFKTMQITMFWGGARSEQLEKVKTLVSCRAHRNLLVDIHRKKARAWRCLPHTILFRTSVRARAEGLFVGMNKSSYAISG